MDYLLLLRTHEAFGLDQGPCVRYCAEGQCAKSSQLNRGLPKGRIALFLFGLLNFPWELCLCQQTNAFHFFSVFIYLVKPCTAHFCGFDSIYCLNVFLRKNNMSLKRQLMFFE